MLKAKTDEKNWIKCGNCGHKICRVVAPGNCHPSPILEFKCHSCKKLNCWMYENNWRKEDVE